MKKITSSLLFISLIFAGQNIFCANPYKADQMVNYVKSESAKARENDTALKGQPTSWSARLGGSLMDFGDKMRSDHFHGAKSLTKDAVEHYSNVKASKSAWSKAFQTSGNVARWFGKNVLGAEVEATHERLLANYTEKHGRAKNLTNGDLAMAAIMLEGDYVRGYHLYDLTINKLTYRYSRNLGMVSLKNTVDGFIEALIRHMDQNEEVCGCADVSRQLHSIIGKIHAHYSLDNIRNISVEKQLNQYCRTVK